MKEKYINMERKDTLKIKSENKRTAGNAIRHGRQAGGNHNKGMNKKMGK